jgi:hypothetical protein
MVVTQILLQWPECKHNHWTISLPSFFFVIFFIHRDLGMLPSAKNGAKTTGA